MNVKMKSDMKFGESVNRSDMSLASSVEQKPLDQIGGRGNNMSLNQKLERNGEETTANVAQFINS